MVESSRPGKQRKEFYSMKLHRIQNSMASHLDKKLREKYHRRALIVRKGDEVKVMKGKYKGKGGKITKAKYSKQFVFIEGIVRKKADGTEKPVAFRPSILLLTTLVLEDERRLGKGKKKEENIKKEEKDKKEHREKNADI